MSTTTSLSTEQAITQRRSVKHYDPAHVMSPETLKELMALVLLSPTSFNMQNWRFVVVTDPSQKEKLCAAAWNQAQVKEASAVVLLCANEKAHEQDPHRYWADAPEAVQKVLVPMIGQFYTNNPALIRDEAMRSIGIAAQTLMLAAKSMGYDTCPMIGFDPAAVAEIIRLPQDHCIGLMITVGKALEPAKGRGGQLPFDEVVSWNSFSG